MRPSAMAILIGFGLAGCTPEPPDISAACMAPAHQTLVGQPESVLATMRFGVPVRVIHPGDAVTMDFSPTRLNFEIDPGGRIAKVACY